MTKQAHARRFAAVIAAALLVTALSSCAQKGVDLSSSVAGQLPWPDAPVSAALATATGTTIVSHNDEFPKPLASTAKLVTVLVALDKHPLALEAEGPTIEVSAADVLRTNELASVGASTLAVGEGGALSQRTLIAGALVASANNYAEMLVQWAFDSEAEFLEHAAKWLRSAGCTETTLVDATGLDPSTEGTATDLVRIGQLALQQPLVAQLVGERQVQLGFGSIENTNTLLNDASYLGLKTGSLEPDGYSLAFARTSAIDDPDATVLVGALLGERSAGFARKHAELLTTAGFGLLEVER